ncbi:MAG TPA: SIMPL domain-containing protein [Casimicrobiaceae bacterium]|nr:SIMPL domain-containing protein [Casimicrobiaceae bacterium]
MTSLHHPLAARRGALALFATALCAAATALGQTPPPQQPTVTVTATATATVINDRLQAWLRAEAENASASAAASQVNAAIAKALAEAKGHPSIKVATAGYSTQQVSDKVKAQRWRVVQTISIDGSDFTAAAALISRLQDDQGLLLSGMGFSLAEKTRRDAEDSVTQQALKSWQTRAQQAAQGLGFASWRPGHVVVQTSDGGRVFPMARAQAMASSTGGAPVAMEGGTTDVTVTVSGEAVLEQSRPPTR